MRTRKQYRALLARAHGYVAYASRMLPARRAPVTSQRAWKLAQAIAARYAAIERRWPVMAFIFERSGDTGAAVSNTFDITHPSIFMNPRLILRMLVSHRENAQRVVAAHTPALPFGTEPASMTLAAPPSLKQGRQGQGDVIARIVRRAVREEHSVTAINGPAARTAIPLTQVAPAGNPATARSSSLIRVYRRDTNANNDTTAITASAGSGKEKPRVVAGRDLSAAVVAPTPSDITRITDQVMQALDKRIVTQRERLGRV
jgi:hypothetical protein